MQTVPLRLVIFILAVLIATPVVSALGVATSTTSGTSQGNVITIVISRGEQLQLRGTLQPGHEAGPTRMVCNQTVDVTIASIGFSCARPHASPTDAAKQASVAADR